MSVGSCERFLCIITREGNRTRVDSLKSCVFIITWDAPRRRRGCAGRHNSIVGSRVAGGAALLIVGGVNGRGKSQDVRGLGWRAQVYVSSGWSGDYGNTQKCQ